MTATTMTVPHLSIDTDSSVLSITPISTPSPVPAPSSTPLTTASHVLSQLQLDTQQKNIVREAVKTVVSDEVKSDDFFRNGVPVSAFPFPSSLDLESLFSTHSHIDPFTLIDTELSNVKTSILTMLGSDHPVIHAVASYFFEKTSGKQFRPAIMHLLARALEAGVVNSPIPKPTPFVTSCDCGCASSYTLPPPSPPTFNINPDQHAMCNIIEVIHTASLLHDDVLDEATTRRGVASINQVFGNKLAILGGDFLLCRASLGIARIQKPQIMELSANIIESLVKGEILQMKPGKAPTLDGNLNIYITKSYYKTASLIAGGCKGVAILGGYDTYVQSIAYEYGKHVGLAFQIVDDIIDFTSTSTQLGKPALNDMTNGIITAPLLYALHDFPQLQPLIDRKFKEQGDIQQALDYLARSDGLDRARVLAVQHCEIAIAAILQLHSSPFQSALIHLVEKVLNREK